MKRDEPEIKKRPEKEKRVDCLCYGKSEEKTELVGVGWAREAVGSKRFNAVEH